MTLSRVYFNFTYQKLLFVVSSHNIMISRTTPCTARGLPHASKGQVGDGSLKGWAQPTQTVPVTVQASL
jgi:hypothetical protein